MIYEGQAAEDVKRILHYIVDDYIEYDDGDYSPKGYYCIHCWAGSKYNPDKTKIEHFSDCPYLIAKDLLTGTE